MTPDVPFLCSPPRLPADTRSKRFFDRIHPTGSAQWFYFAAIAAGISAAPHLPTRLGLGVGALFTFAASAWCVVNFWRCREAHCVVSGYGWAALGVFEVAELALGRSLIGGAESLVFVAVLVVAVVFELAWRARAGTSALISAGTTGRR